MPLRAPKIDYRQEDLVSNDRPVDPTEAVQLVSSFNEAVKETKRESDGIPTEPMLSNNALNIETRAVNSLRLAGFKIYDSARELGLSIYKKGKLYVSLFLNLNTNNGVEISIQTDNRNADTEQKMEIFSLLLKSGLKMIADHYSEGILYYRIEKL